MVKKNYNFGYLAKYPKIQIFHTTACSDFQKKKKKKKIPKIIHQLTVMDKNLLILSFLVRFH